MSEPSSSTHSRHNADPVPSSVEPASAWNRIREHKVLQWSLAYLGTALALAHGQELLAHTFHWPELVGRILMAALIAGFPIAVALAWYHGHRGMTRVSAPEMTVVSLLVLIGAALLVALVRVPQERALHERGLQEPASASSAAAPVTPAVRAASSAAAASTESALAPASSKPRLAILPFENLSPDPANAFFTDGLHEEIITTLSNRAPDLDVISRTTMMTYRTPKPVQVIARELGATHVLEGSVRREGNAVRLTLQLINARSDRHIWSQDYDRTLKSALTLQSEVANEVASQLAVRFAVSALKAPTRDPLAYDFYLKAGLLVTNYVRGADTPLELFQQVEQLLSEALARDPDFARAYAARAGMPMLRFAYNYDTPQHAGPLAKKDLDAAERLAPGDPVVLFQQAMYLYLLERDPTAAIATLESARDTLDPVLLAVSSQAYAAAGRFDEAVQRTRRAMALDPKNPPVYAQSMLALLLTRQPAQALRVANLASVKFPAVFPSWRAYIVWAHTGVGPPTAALTGLGPFAELSANSDARSVKTRLFPLRMAHRYQEMADYLGRASVSVIRGEQSLGAHPVAELRGWVHLLLGDRAAAAQDGRQVLAFIARTEETKWNRAFLTALAAEGNTFIGERGTAIADAQKALRLAETTSERLNAQPVAAAVYAWSGAADDAASLLEQLSTLIPMNLDLAPAAIARDPLYTVPLARNARYQALRARIEAQMAATKLE